MAAGRLGVWGLLTRQDKVKHISVHASPFVAHFVDARTGALNDVANGHAAAGLAAKVRPRSLATLRSDRLLFTASEDREHVALQFALPRLAVDIVHPEPARVTSEAESSNAVQHDDEAVLPLLLGDFDFLLRAHEHFPGGTTYPRYVSRWVASPQTLRLRLCAARLKGLVAVARCFLEAPAARPDPVGEFPEQEPDVRVRFRVAALEIELLSEAGAEASCELARLNCERFDAEYNSWDGDTPHTTHNTTSLSCAAFEVRTSLRSGGQAVEPLLCLTTEEDLCQDGAASHAASPVAKQLPSERLPNVECAPLEAIYPSPPVDGSSDPSTAVPLTAAVQPPRLHVTWQKRLTPRLRQLQELRTLASPLVVRADAYSLAELHRQLLPLLKQAGALAALAAPCSQRFMLHGAYRHAWLIALEKDTSPMRVLSLSSALCTSRWQSLCARAARSLSAQRERCWAMRSSCKVRMTTIR